MLGNVMIIDDEPDIVEAMAEMLQMWSPELTIATSVDSREGLSQVLQGKFDLVITDYKMPGLDGSHILKRITEGCPDIEKILITAYPDLPIAIEAINELGVRFFLNKPVAPDELIKRVGAALGFCHDRRRREAGYLGRFQ